MLVVKVTNNYVDIQYTRCHEWPVTSSDDDDDFLLPYLTFFNDFKKEIEGNVTRQSHVNHNVDLLGGAEM